MQSTFTHQGRRLRQESAARQHGPRTSTQTQYRHRVQAGWYPKSIINASRKKTLFVCSNEAVTPLSSHTHARARALPVSLAACAAFSFSFSHSLVFWPGRVFALDSSKHQAHTEGLSPRQGKNGGGHNNLIAYCIVYYSVYVIPEGRSAPLVLSC